MGASRKPKAGDLVAWKSLANRWPPGWTGLVIDTCQPPSGWSQRSVDPLVMWSESGAIRVSRLSLRQLRVISR